MADCTGTVGMLMEAPRAPEVAVSPSADVIINKVSNGFVVRIGCKVLVAKTWQEVSDGLDMYWKHPDAARAKYCHDDASLKQLPELRRKIRDLSRNRPRKIRRNRKNR